MAVDNGFFADQFDNLSNYRAHLATGREILMQTSGKLDAFVCGAGTGGTLAGVSCELKSRSQRIRTYLVDPPGSSLLLKVLYTHKVSTVLMWLPLCNRPTMRVGMVLLFHYTSCHMCGGCQGCKASVARAQAVVVMVPTFNSTLPMHQWGNCPLYNVAASL
jgi:hypothetical protein